MKVWITYNILVNYILKNPTISEKNDTVSCKKS